MSKTASPAVGFNDNVRRRNRNFHVQTEDSGVARPHIITHLFTDGGRIVKSVRQGYADIVEEEQLTRHVRERMKAQHVGMLEALKSGEFDALVWGSRAPGKKSPEALGARTAAPPPSTAVSSEPASNQRTSVPRPLVPRIAATPPVSVGAVASRARKSAPPKARRTSRPPPRSVARSPGLLANPRESLVSQTLDEVILRMLSEEQDSQSGS